MLINVDFASSIQTYAILQFPNSVNDLTVCCFFFRFCLATAIIATDAMCSRILVHSSVHIPSFVFRSSTYIIHISRSLIIRM